MLIINLHGANFTDNVRHIEQRGGLVTFGVAATRLAWSEAQWNTLGLTALSLRCRARSDEHDRTAQLMRDVLRSAKEYLRAEGGEMHVLRQFSEWALGEALRQLDLEVAYWSELDADALQACFAGYTPRSSLGTAVEVAGLMHLCSFKRKDGEVVWAGVDESPEGVERDDEQDEAKKSSSDDGRVSPDGHETRPVRGEGEVEVHEEEASSQAIKIDDLSTMLQMLTPFTVPKQEGVDYYLIGKFAAMKLQHILKSNKDT